MNCLNDSITQTLQNAAMTDSGDELTRKALSSATKWRAKRRLALGMVVLGAFPAGLIVLGICIDILIGCAFDNGPAYCGDLNHPLTMTAGLLIMLGMYGIFTLPILLAGVIWWQRLKRDRPAP